MKQVIVIVLLFSGLLSKAQVQVGQMAPDISLHNTKDSIINLSSFRGKVVLIDFWASWCGPCRASNPKVVKLYKKYKVQGFEVLGISIDSEEKDWLRAIRQDRLPYTQVIEKGGWDTGPIAKKYAVEAIPNTFLLDKEGRIVAINMEGKELEEKVKLLLQ